MEHLLELVVEIKYVLMAVAALVLVFRLLVHPVTPESELEQRHEALRKAARDARWLREQGI